MVNKTNDIIFADLSTYSPEETIPFYESVFGWKYYEDNGYFLAYKGQNPIAGLYETPEKFKQIRMPHFWMTYIRVDDIQFVIDNAKRLGGIIEMVDEENEIGSVALIRDPKGAGFTVYEGNKLQSTRTENEFGTLVWNELHVSDADKIIPFYQGIFNWEFKKIRKDYYEIYNKRKRISNVLQIPKSVKGKYEYWVCVFAVENLQSTGEKIIKHGGKIVSDEGSRVLFVDNSGQAFFYVSESDS